MLQNRRTDLALEAQELWQESAGEQTQLKGVQARDSRREGYAVTTVRILDQEGAQALGKPAGTYVTLTVDGLARREEDAFGRAVRAVAAEMTQLLAGLEGPVLVACLGNRAVTPDAVGPKVHDHLLITRHLVDQAPEHFGAFRPVASVAAGVLGTTGVESGELVGALTGRLKPVCIIAVDALAVPDDPACGHGHCARLRGGQPPPRPGPGELRRAGDRHRGAHGGGRRYTGGGPAGDGGPAPSGPGGRDAGHAERY